MQGLLSPLSSVMRTIMVEQARNTSPGRYGPFSDFYAIGGTLQLI
jgi:hypothetical protein